MLGYASGPTVGAFLLGTRTRSATAGGTLIGMLLAAELHLRLSQHPVMCAKLHHDNPRRCIFRCGYAP